MRHSFGLAPCDGDRTGLLPVGPSLPSHSPCRLPLSTVSGGTEGSAGSRPHSSPAQPLNICGTLDVSNLSEPQLPLLEDEKNVFFFCKVIVRVKQHLGEQSERGWPITLPSPVFTPGIPPYR